MQSDRQAQPKSWQVTGNSGFALRSFDPRLVLFLPPFPDLAFLLSLLLNCLGNIIDPMGSSITSRAAKMITGKKVTTVSCLLKLSDE